MDQATHNRIVSFLWGIADDVLRDLFKRGKYPDVILPMCVLRRLDAVLEPSKAKVLAAKQQLDAAKIKEQDAALRAAAGQAFYNISPFVLRDLSSRGSEQQLRADFEAYLEGFSENVQDILENFKFRNHIPTLSRSDSLGTLISKFLDPQIDLSQGAARIVGLPTEPLLAPTRRLIQPIGGVDVAPVVWLGLISLLRELLVGQQGLLTQVMLRAAAATA